MNANFCIFAFIIYTFFLIYLFWQPTGNFGKLKSFEESRVRDVSRPRSTARCSQTIGKQRPIGTKKKSRRGL